MNQDHINMIMLALLAINTLLLMYCCYKSSSEEFRAGQKTSGSFANDGATKRSAGVAAAAAPSAARLPAAVVTPAAARAATMAPRAMKPR